MNYTVNVSIPKPLADMAHEQVKKGYYATFSEVVRAALRRLLVEDHVPTFQMSKKAQRRVARALKEYRQGKTIRVTSVKDLL